MKPQTQSPDALGFLPPPPLTPEQRAIVLARRASEWNKPMSLWTKIVFTKERKAPSAAKAAPVSKPAIAKKK